ncbi:hypothetical protein CE182_03760 [Klebsiella pneumoniae]|nr:hypothetical protein CE182_03760 [Klebsiella pneumoniae]
MRDLILQLSKSSIYSTKPKKSKNDFLYQTGVRVITMKHKLTMPGLTPSVYCRDVRQDDGLK